MPIDGNLPLPPQARLCRVQAHAVKEDPSRLLPVAEPSLQPCCDHEEIDVGRAYLQSLQRSFGGGLNLAALHSRSDPDIVKFGRVRLALDGVTNGSQSLLPPAHAHRAGTQLAGSQWRQIGKLTGKPIVLLCQREISAVEVDIAFRFVKQRIGVIRILAA